MNNEVAEVKRLYTLIVNGEFGDDSDGVQQRVNIIKKLEEITHRNFRNTAEFHHLVADYIKNQEGKRLTTGEQVRKKRHERKWTQAMLADHLGVTKRTVINYEAGNTPPTERLLAWLNAGEVHMGKSETGGITGQTPEKGDISYGEK
jgi:DNA-binding XRE family transcriptional regulator